MFDIGFWEMLFCGVIGLIVIGPDKLPSALHSISKVIKSLRQTASHLSAELGKELDVKAMEQQLESLNKPLNQDLKD
ncbi:Sec-independent protein translocase protein TatB [Agarivorans sp. Alg241-V36]|uniref:Sec-independent protein translocase protein TatB n=1 Tax=Agarivorans sp. Alg241-V36 TaxID=2305992 RepID=UPI0013D537FF|nr:Sec-independent protein translocase protein TatB [Agarivorans sp. Alg241-V36]